MFDCFIEDNFIKVVFRLELQHDADGKNLLEKIKLLLPNCLIKQIVFTFDGEPLNPVFYNNIFRVIPTLVNANLDAKIKIFSGIEPIDENVEFYKGMCNSNGWPAVEFIMFNQWEACSGKTLYVSTKTVDYVTKLRKKIFLSLNAGFRPNRLQFVAELINRNLLKMGFVSFLCGNGDSKAIIRNNILGSMTAKKYFPQTYESIKNIVRKNIDIFPLVLDYDPKFGNQEEWLMKHQYSSNNLMNCYDNSYLSIVNETTFYWNSHIPGEMYDAYFFSEKVFKPISLKHPFMLCSHQGSLAILRKKGYRTFHPFIDESYDLKHGEDRILAVIDELQRLSSFTDRDWLDWQENIKPIVDYNYEVLKNVKLIEKCVN